MDGWIFIKALILLLLSTWTQEVESPVLLFRFSTFEWKYTSHATMIPGIQKRHFPTMFSVNLGSSSFVRTSPARTFFKQICTNKPQKCASSKNLHIIDYHHLSSVDQSSQPWQDSGSLLKSSAFFQLPEIFHDNAIVNGCQWLTMVAIIMKSVLEMLMRSVVTIGGFIQQRGL